MRIGDHILVVRLLALVARQRGDVLLDERLDGSHVEAAHKVEGEVGCIGRALLGNGQCAVVAYVLEILDIERLLAPAVVAHGVAHAVGKHALGTQALVFECVLDEAHGGVILLLVLLDVGEVQVVELEHRLQVLLGGVAVEASVGSAHVEIDVHVLASQGLGELGIAEVAQTAHANDGAEERAGGIVLGTVERAAALGLGLILDFVFLEGGGFEHHLGAVAQGELGVAQLVILGLFHDLARLGHGAHEGLLLHVVDIGLNLGCVGSVDGSLEAGHCGIDGALFLLVEVDHDHVGVAQAHKLLEGLVDGLDGNVGGKHVHHLVLGLDRGHGLLLQVVAGIEAAKALGALLVAVVVGLLQVAQVVALGALILGGCEAVLAGLEHCLEGTLQGLGGLAFLGEGIDLEGVFGLGEEILAVAGTCLDKRAVGVLGLLLEAHAKHLVDHVLHIAVGQILHAALHVLGEGIVLVHELHYAVLLLLVFVDHDDGLVVVGHGLLGHLGSVFGRCGNRAEELLDLVDGVGHVDVAHHDDGLVVGTIPLVVVVAQLLVLEAVDHAHQAYGHALAILGAGIERLEVALKHALARGEAHAPLLVYHAALLVDFLVLEQQAIAPVLEDEQARVEGTLAAAGHVADVVHRLVDAGVGVQVTAKFHTQRAGVVDHAVALEVLGAVEAHVLQEVGQAALALLFLQRAHTLSNVEVYMVLRVVVVAHVVGESVGKLACVHGCVLRHGHVLSHGTEGTGQ